MAENNYWFARRFPVGHPRNAMAPINEKGWNAVWKFVIWMVGGALVAGLILAANALWLPGMWIGAPFIFAACAAVGGWSLILAAQQHGDHNHTVEDYKAGRVQ
jgi:hypothetical protein